MLKTAAVDVAATLRQSAADVLHQARATFAANLALYRDGCRRMAESGGTLSADEAADLLRVCRELDIPADRLESDWTAMLRHSRIEAVLADADRRNSEQAEKAARLQAKLDAEQQEWTAIRVECEQRIKAAQAKLDSVSREYQQAANFRPERLDEKREELLRLQDGSPHLFRDVEPEQLRRIVHPQIRPLFP